VQTVLEDARKLSACINLPTLDVAFYQACCGTDVYAAGLGGAYSSYAGPSVACVSSGFQVSDPLDHALSSSLFTL
jgi:hypothetical protein